MKTFAEYLESVEDKPYYHGSFNKLTVGTVLHGRKQEYEKDWGDNAWYQILHTHKPADMLHHRDAVFMVDNIDDMDVSGSPTEWIFTLQPLGVVEKHDMNWISEIESLLSEGKDKNDEEVIKAAISYWNGTPHSNERVWEYLTPSARIVKVEEGF